MKIYQILCFLVAVLLLAGCKTPPAVVKTLKGEAMGTTWTLAWRGTDVDGLDKKVSTVLTKWESVLSQWRDDSDLSRHNAGAPATPELERVTALAHEIHEESAGAFDYKLLKETSDAGFGPEGSGLDLSAIGKGFAVDRVGEKLRKLGITDFIFELGGEVLAGDGEWEVEIENPDPATRSTLRTEKLNNRALATSGNYRQFKPDPGGLSSHIIDPRTRKPIIRPPSSVTVIAADCATADAWATALFVLGPDIPAPEGLTVKWNKAKE